MVVGRPPRELTCHCHRVEDIEVVFPIVVTSETEARGGREEGWKVPGLDCCCCFVLLLLQGSPELEKMAGLELLGM